MSELGDDDDDGQLSLYFSLSFLYLLKILFSCRYVNYDWEDARDRNLRDGRESYFRSRWLTINIVIIKKVVNI